MAAVIYAATGKRKTAVARVRLHDTLGREPPKEFFSKARRFLCASVNINYCLGVVAHPFPRLTVLHHAALAS